MWRLYVPKSNAYFNHADNLKQPNYVEVRMNSSLSFWWVTPDDNGCKDPFIDLQKIEHKQKQKSAQDGFYSLVEAVGDVLIFRNVNR